MYLKCHLPSVSPFFPSSCSPPLYFLLPSSLPSFSYSSLLSPSLPLFLLSLNSPLPFFTPLAVTLQPFPLTLPSPLLTPLNPQETPHPFSSSPSPPLMERSVTGGDGEVRGGEGTGEGEGRQRGKEGRMYVICDFLFSFFSCIMVSYIMYLQKALQNDIYIFFSITNISISVVCSLLQQVFHVLYLLLYHFNVTLHIFQVIQNNNTS